MALLLPQAFPNQPPGAWTALWCAGRGDASLPRKASGKMPRAEEVWLPSPNLLTEPSRAAFGDGAPRTAWRRRARAEATPRKARPEALEAPILRGKRKPNQGHASFPRARPQRRAPFSRARPQREPPGGSSSHHVGTDGESSSPGPAIRACGTQGR